VVYAAVGAFVGSSTWALLATCAVGVSFFVRPVEGSAVAKLAPAQFDVVVNTTMNLLEGYSERQDAEHYQREYHKEAAKRRADVRAESEKEDETIFRELAEEMAPEENGDAGGVLSDD
jgi:elongation factor P--beta-lysine ligase